MFTESSPWTIFAVLMAGGVFCFGISCMIYVAYRFLSLVLTLDSAMLREFKFQAAVTTQAMDTAGQAIKSSSVQPDKLREFIQSRMTPTQGEFVPYSDEEAFLNETVDHLRRQGLNDAELDAFVRQAVGTDIGKPEN